MFHHFEYFQVTEITQYIYWNVGLVIAAVNGRGN